MAIISGATSGTGADVDATSKAMRVTLYDSAGNELNAVPNGTYLLPVNIRQTAATAAGATVWALRNGATRVIQIRQISLSIGFDGTAALATTQRYEIERFSAATPTTGTALTPLKKRNSYAASSVADARFVDTGLTTTSVVFESPFTVFGLPISLTASNALFQAWFETGTERYDGLELAINEGICIRLQQTAVIGTSLNGFIEWDER